MFLWKKCRFCDTIWKMVVAMELTKKSFILFILTIILLPLFGNESLNAYLHISSLVTIVNYLIPGLLCLFLIVDMIKQKKFPKLEFNLFATILFWIILILSFIFSITHQIFNFSNLFKFGCMTFILFIIKDINFTEKEKKLICYSLIGIASIISIIGILQYMFQISLNVSGIEKYIGALGRINSTTYIATLLDKYLALNIFLVLFFMYKKWFNIYLLSSALLLYILALAFTFSRSGLLIFIFISIFFFILFLFKKQFINSLIILIFAIGMYFIPGENFVYSSLAKYLINIGSSISEKTNISFVDKTFNFFLSPFVIDIYDYYEKENNNTSNNNDNSSNIGKPIGNNNSNPTIDSSVDDTKKPAQNYDDIDIQLKENIDYSLNSRSYYQTIAKHIMKQYWQYGIGIGSYTHIYNNQNVNDYLENTKFNYDFRYPHNMYYQLGAETGIFGLIFFFINFIYMLVKSSFKNKTLIPILLCICILLICYTESVFYMKDIAYFTIIIIGLFSNNSFLKNKSNNLK